MPGEAPFDIMFSRVANTMNLVQNIEQSQLRAQLMRQEIERQDMQQAEWERQAPLRAMKYELDKKQMTKETADINYFMENEKHLRQVALEAQEADTAYKKTRAKVEMYEYEDKKDLQNRATQTIDEMLKEEKDPVMRTLIRASNVSNSLVSALGGYQETLKRTHAEEKKVGDLAQWRAEQAKQLEKEQQIRVLGHIARASDKLMAIETARVNGLLSDEKAQELIKTYKLNKGSDPKQTKDRLSVLKEQIGIAKAKLATASANAPVEISKTNETDMSGDNFSTTNKETRQKTETPEMKAAKKTLDDLMKSLEELSGSDLPQEDMPAGDNDSDMLSDLFPPDATSRSTNTLVVGGTGSNTDPFVLGRDYSDDEMEKMFLDGKLKPGVYRTNNALFTVPEE